MLLQVTPELVAKHWEFFAPGIEAANRGVNPNSHFNLNNTLAAIQSEEAQVWAEQDASGEPAVIVVTTVLSDKLAGTNTLHIHSMFSLKPMSRGVIRDGWANLFQFAKSRGCSFITALAVDPNIIKIAGLVGLKEKVKFLSMEI